MCLELHKLRVFMVRIVQYLEAPVLCTVFKVNFCMKPTMSFLLGGLWGHWLWDAEKLFPAWCGVGQELRRGGNLFCFLFSDYIAICFIVPWYVFTTLQVCITDPDLIEKSNLNRQFLFRPHHIQVNRLPFPNLLFFFFFPPHSSSSISLLKLCLFCCIMWVNGKKISNHQAGRYLN